MLAVVFAAMIQGIFAGFYIRQYHWLLVAAGAILLAVSCMVIDWWKRTVFVYMGLIAVLLLLCKNMLINGFRIISNKMADAINQSMDMGFYYYVSVDLDHSREDCVFAIIFFFLCAGLVISLLRLRPIILFVTMGICEILLLIVSPYSISAPFFLFLGAWFAYYNFRKNKRKFGMTMFLLMLFPAFMLHLYDQMAVPKETWMKTATLKQIRHMVQGSGYQVTGGIGNGEIGKTGAVSPTGTRLFQVTSDNKDTLFLKGFVSGDYKDGTWQKEDADVKIFTGEPAMGIPFLFPELEIGNLFDDGLQQQLFHDSEELLIHYQKKNDIYLLASYFSDVNGMEANQSGDTSLFRVSGKKDYEIRYYGIKDTKSFLRLEGSVTDAVMEKSKVTDVEKHYFQVMNEYKEYVMENYRKVSKEQRNEITKKYADVLKGKTLAEKVEHITQYLQKGYQYTYRPGLVPEGKDPVLYFLNDTKKGFCTQYASAAVMMLRCAGIPARYVEGYKIDKTRWDGEKTVQVTDYDAHAWAEIFVSNVGWIPVDVTGTSGGRSTYEAVWKSERKNQKLNVTKDRVCTYIKTIVIFLAVLGAAVGVFMLGKMLRKKYLWKHYDNREKILRYSEIIEKYQENPEKTWKNNEVIDELVFQIIQKAKYSPYEISDEETNTVHRYVEILRK